VRVSLIKDADRHCLCPGSERKGHERRSYHVASGLRPLADGIAAVPSRQHRELPQARVVVAEFGYGHVRPLDLRLSDLRNAACTSEAFMIAPEVLLAPSRVCP
jgi:hypothetical protein